MKYEYKKSVAILVNCEVIICGGATENQRYVTDPVTSAEW